MLTGVSYGVVAVFLASMVHSMFRPEAMHGMMLAFVLASPALLGLIIWHERM